MNDKSETWNHLIFGQFLILLRNSGLKLKLNDVHVRNVQTCREFSCEWKFEPKLTTIARKPDLNCCRE